MPRLLPEAILTISLICVCFADLFQTKKVFYKKGWETIWIAALGLLLSIIALVWRLPQPPSLILGGAFAEDSLGIAFRLIIAMGSFICIFLCLDYFQMGGIPAAEFTIFVLASTIGGMLLSGSNDLVLAFVAFRMFKLKFLLTRRVHEKRPSFTRIGCKIFNSWKCEFVCSCLWVFMALWAWGRKHKFSRDRDLL